jgi:hypothetical protein
MTVESLLSRSRLLANSSRCTSATNYSGFAASKPVIIGSGLDDSVVSLRTEVIAIAKEPVTGNSKE